MDHFDGLLTEQEKDVPLIRGRSGLPREEGVEKTARRE
jgi:hypothetical protein